MLPLWKKKISDCSTIEGPKNSQALRKSDSKTNLAGGGFAGKRERQVEGEGWQMCCGSMSERDTSFSAWLQRGDERQIRGGWEGAEKSVQKKKCLPALQGCLTHNVPVLLWEKYVTPVCGTFLLWGLSHMCKKRWMPGWKYAQHDKGKEFSLLHKREKWLHTCDALCHGGGFQRHLEAVKKLQTRQKKKKKN